LRATKWVLEYSTLADRRARALYPQSSRAKATTANAHNTLARNTGSGHCCLGRGGVVLPKTLGAALTAGVPFFGVSNELGARTARGSARAMSDDAEMASVAEIDRLSTADVPRIDASRQIFPYCIVWTPIPVLTWLFPFVGHMGVGDSKGVLHDFAGPYYIGHGELAFGAPTRYVRLAPRKGWDAAVQSANGVYCNRMHNICFQNCHSHVATALDAVELGGWRRWNMVCFETPVAHAESDTFLWCATYVVRYI